MGRPFLTTSFADLDRFKAGARRRLEISIDWLKANPNKASAGIAVSSFHLLTAFFQKETATQFAFVPYRGVARAVQDLVAGQIDLLFSTPDALPLMGA